MKLSRLISLSKKWIRDEWFPLIKICGKAYDKMMKSNKIKKKPMCGKELFLVPY
jgi:hypothetical protein